MITDQEKKKRRKNKRKRKPVKPGANSSNTNENVGIDDAEHRKRPIEDDDSDVEVKPKRKKKKKPLVAEDAPNQKGKKSIRQMKREKYAQRQADAHAAAKDQHKSECLNYLSQWKHNKEHWKFMKMKQMWLFKNKFSSHLVPDESWPLLLEYFESCQGQIRKLLLDDAENVIKKLDEWTEKQSKAPKQDTEETLEDDEDAADDKPDDTTYKRARDLIQCLQE